MDENELGAVMEVQSVDIDGDGIADGIMTVEDTNFDGIADTVRIIADTNDNGIADSMVIMQDTNADGEIDTIVGACAVDTNGDGAADTIAVYEDIGADGVIENLDLIPGSEAEFDAAFGDTSDYIYIPNGYEQFDPETADMDSIIGVPANDISVWEYQGESGPCAIYAQAMAYQNVTGEEVDITELIETASEEGWYDGSGTSIDDMDKVLNYLGIDADVEYRGDLDDIRECLEAGGRVVVAVDGNEIWVGDNDTCFTPNDPNHAIEIIGIDYSGDEPMVIINDSGTPDGHGIMVPKDQFIDAWEDSDFAYVEVYPRAA